jgi:protocadherin-16/23
VFQQPSYTATVLENIARGSLVPALSMIVTDPDVGTAAFFNLTVKSSPSPVADIFGVVPDSGQGAASASLVVWRPEYLSFLNVAQRQYIVTVTATDTDAQQLSGSTTVTINVQPANLPPYFNQLSYSASIRDDRPPGTVILTVSAIDTDAGMLGTLTYSILPADQNYIEIDANSGTIRLRQQVSYATVQVLSYTLVVTDGAGRTDMVPLTISILNSRSLGPVFSRDDYQATVMELQNNLQPPIIIYASPLQRDRVVTYSIVGGNEQNLFWLDPNSGNLTMLHGVDIIDTPGHKGSYQLTVQASDNGVVPVFNNASVTINVMDTNNHAPNFTAPSYRGSITEATPPGTTILQVNSTDLDVGQNALITYIVGPGGRDNFGINPVTGDVYVSPTADLSVDRPPTYYNVTVFAVDHGSPQLTGSTVVYITVTGSDRPVFNQTSYTFLVKESEAVGNTVGIVMATVAATNVSDIVYSIIPGTLLVTNASGYPVTSAQNTYDYSKSFNIDPASGAVRVNGPLSYQYASVFFFKVLAVNNRAQNQLTKSDSTNVTIYVSPTARPPLGFYPPTLPTNPTILREFTEELPIGTSVFTLQAYDLDNPTLPFTYEILNGSDPNGYLTMDKKTGVISIAKRVDYETMAPPKQILLYVRAGHNNQSTSATIIFTVQDINDNAPVFLQDNYKFIIFNNATTGQTVGTVTATDADSGPYGIVSYMITAGNIGNYFSVDPNTGVISTITPLTSPGIYNLIVTAMDNPSGQGIRLSNITKVTIVVVDISSGGNGISFSGSSNYYTVESAPINSSVGFVSANDYLSSANITYSIAGGNDLNLFRINPITGEITVNKSLINYGRPNAYLLNISGVAIGSNPPRTGFTTIAILILNQTDTTAGKVFFISPPDAQEFFINELSPMVYVTTVSGGVINRPGVTDVNYFFLVNGTFVTSTGRFSIDPVKGVITFNGTDFDLTDPTTYSNQLTLVVRDTGSPPLQSDTRVVTVSINNPTFESCPNFVQPLVVHINEDVKLGSPVLTLHACNPATNAPVYYYIIGGNSRRPNTTFDPFVIIPPSSGIMFTNDSFLNYITTYNLTVIARNQPTDFSKVVNASGSRMVVSVVIDDVDNNGPSFTQCGGIGSAVGAGVRDFPTTGQSIIQMIAGDCDVKPENRLHTYSLSPIAFTGDYGSEPDTKAFVIDKMTGNVYPALTTYRPYSFGNFTTTVTATDSSGRSDTSRLTIYVVKESDEIRNTYGDRPAFVKSSASDFLSNLKNELVHDTDTQGIVVSESGLHYHINDSKTSSFGWRTFVDRPYLDRSQSDLCFYVIKDQKLMDYDSNKATFDQLDVSGNGYCTNISCALSRCYPHLTTHEWSGHMWTWWWLIALALLIFLIALIVAIAVCCVAGWSESKYNTNQMYVYLDAPGGAPPASEFEWHNQPQRIN